MAIKNSKITKKPRSLREALDGKLSEKELSILTTAFDVVGDIAIIEIRAELVKKEKIIAKALLDMLNNINVVCKKADIHKGVFRTQKMTILAGENRLETIHKENNVQIMLDVEKAYFSTRLGTERKRITELVKEGEDILVMFSGVAPYPCVLSKNTKARTITGIEINPAGFSYGLKNIKLNKLDNVELYQGDVNEIIPLLSHIKIGLKANWKPIQLEKRLNFKPHIMEFYLGKGDVENNLPKIEEAIKKVRDKGMKLMIHSPHHYNGEFLRIITESDTEKKALFDYFEKIMPIFEKYENLIGLNIHPTEDPKEDSEQNRDLLFENLIILKKKHKKLFDYLYLENENGGMMASPNPFIELNKKIGLKNLIFDLAHHYNEYGSMDVMIKDIKKLGNYLNLYFHIVDSDGDYIEQVRDCVPIGEGHLDFESLTPLMDIGVIEVNSKDENNPVEMFDGYKRIINLKKEEKKTFDRVLMPLPKSAEDFLDIALTVVKKGTILHFYDFLNEAEFILAHEKIEKACKKAGLKYKILNTVKCGQHAPRVFRICVDVKIL